jgi:L-threonylcarbamoyladenylate synthase
VEVILDGGPCAVGVESTVLSLTTDPPQLLRPGGVSVEELEEAIGTIAKVPTVQAVPQSPGLLPQHYAPRTPLLLLDEQEPLPREAGRRIGLLTLTDPPRREGFAAVEVLSPNGDLREAAARFFAAVHRLDRLGLDLIVARPIPEQGLGLALMDRLRKAQAASLPGRRRPSKRYLH